jgi:hypothetical protein
MVAKNMSYVCLERVARLQLAKHSDIVETC